MTHVQPVPVAVPGVIPVGTTSVTVAVPLVDDVPALLMVRVKPPVPPCATVLVVGVIATDNKGAPAGTVTVADEV